MRNGTTASHDSALDGRRLILASNREPFKVVNGRNGKDRKYEPSVGGLATALNPVLSHCEGLWISWNPVPAAANGHATVKEMRGDDVPFPLVQIGLQKDEIKGYYNGFCNRALWPLCHGNLRYVTPRLDYWHRFRDVNYRFADTIASHAAPGDVVWIHDYHLMLVPAALRRQLGPGQPMGYFHHVPFPNARILSAFPWHRRLLVGMLGADSVAFHTPEYATNFIECCRELLNCEADANDGVIQYRDHRTVVGVRPIGLDVDQFEAFARDASVQWQAEEIRKKTAGSRLVLSVDRIDYTKGLLERVDAIRTFFARLPQARGVVTFMQIAVPSRLGVSEYREYRDKLEAAVKSLNKEFGRDNWQPMIYRTDSLDQRALAAHYLAADVVLVTPAKDGMNLIASEYCASRIDGDGAVVLSYQAGASTYLGEFVVNVNANRKDSIVNGIVQALTLSPAERAYRMTRLRSLVRKNTTRVWLGHCLRDIVRPGKAGSAASPGHAAGARRANGNGAEAAKTSRPTATGSGRQQKSRRDNQHSTHHAIEPAP
ncbi:MAG: alpha,alpha-trehalose-phosphate synthase (UDP-forming) [Woeseiaceae bacterium]